MTTSGLEPSTKPWRSGVYYQRLFLTGLRSECFEVARGCDLESSESGEMNIEHNLRQVIEAAGATSIGS